MSKSLGNGIDPLEMIEKYGTDALRLSLIIGSTPGNDLKVYEEKIETYRNFVNKLWNISRYILMSVPEVHRVEKRPEAKTLADEWILGEIDFTVSDVKDNLENYRFSPAGEVIYDFTWNKFADKYLEIAKNEKSKDEILLYVLERLLIVLHPFAPFVSEEIWKSFESGELLMIKKWPLGTLDRESYEETKKKFEVIWGIITDIRNYRATYNISYSNKIKEVIIYYRELTFSNGYAEIVKKKENNREDSKLIEDHVELIKHLVKIENLYVSDTVIDSKDMDHITDGSALVYCSTEGKSSSEKEKENLLKEKENLEKYITGLKSKLENETFVSKAPAKIVEQEKGKLAESEESLRKIEEKLKLIG
jgi:valyl-tRNA synthetase